MEPFRPSAVGAMDGAGHQCRGPRETQEAQMKSASFGVYGIRSNFEPDRNASNFPGCLWSRFVVLHCCGRVMTEAVRHRHERFNCLDLDPAKTGGTKQILLFNGTGTSTM